MKITMKRNLIVGFGISLLILLTSSIASYLSIQNLLKSARLVDHTNGVIIKLELTSSAVKDAETGQRGFLLTGMDEFLQPYTGSYDKTVALTQEIKQLTSDNPSQQIRIDKLSGFIKGRFSFLQALIDKRRAGMPADLNDLRNGKIYMDNVRRMVSDMENEENRLLVIRTADLKSFAAYTPGLIITAAVLALIITIVFYLRMIKDIDMRMKLQQELLRKEASMAHRIGVIKDISEKISSGNYGTRITETEKDELGGIANALNAMAASLQNAFEILSEKEWLQTGLASISGVILGNEHIDSLGREILAFIAEYTNSQVGALYINENDHLLKLQTVYAIAAGQAKESVAFGEGGAGQCAVSKKRILITGIKEENFNISLTTAELKPVNIIVFPLLSEDKVNGVIEFGALHTYTKRELEFFDRLSENIGIAVSSLQNRQKIQSLLEQTQSQAEELMAQQSELEHINTELEQQTQQLQTSEEELKVQSEELTETNTLLEEKSSVLEERNQLIMQKNAAIEKTMEELALSTKYKSEFLANMSHELRTPLNSILLLSRLMSENNDGNLTDEQVQYAKVIQSSGNGLLELIDEILDLSKIESGKMTIEYQPVKISMLTAGLNALFEPQAAQQQLEWKISVGAEVPQDMETDRMRFEQILKNLLSNAFKFTSAGFIHLLVSCPPHQPGYICFSVKDSGIGIQPEKKELIFEAFQQEDGSTRRKYGGTGLGLSISRQLAKLLGGEITLTSTPGQGSEFTCCIPVKHDALQPLPLQEKPGAAAFLQTPAEVLAEKSFNRQPVYKPESIPEEISDDRNNLTAQDKVILIIEDDVSFAAALLDYTRQKKYKGLVAVRGDEGIDMAEKYLPSGVLLDIRLPVKNGWEVLEALKNNPHTKHIPVHIMSSLEAKTESLLKGAADFINKPVAFEQLNTIFEKIEYVLGNRSNKVLIIEENNKHAKALAYYLGTYNVYTEIHHSAEEAVQSLYRKETDCVILDMGIAEENGEAMLESIRANKGLEELPIILFTGKALSQPEEFKIKQYADAIVMKTANSYQRVLDEVSLFLHLVHNQQNKKGAASFEKSVLKENVLEGKTVLLADDDVRNIYSMTKVLEKYKMKVIPAMDGKEAMQLIHSKQTDVVLMDMMMPQMDGYETIKAIRNIRAFKGLPVIAVTAKAMSGDREKCIAAGASDYISKPVDMDQLVSLLRIWLYEKGY